ncbi:hypothetical protein ACIBQ5_36665 [Streptomyces massasporeus]|uniref:hypothetical protein n=1 Tax=Streptomyces massasporeus TaxID=67324 RepID=UPI0037B807CF
MRIEHPVGTLELHQVPDELREALLGMPISSGSADSAHQSDAVFSTLPATVISRLEQFIEYRVADTLGEDALAIQTLVRTARHEPRPPRPETTLRLSRFAFIRQGSEGPLLESPRSARRVRLLNFRAGALVGALGAAPTPRQLAAALGVSVAEAVRLTGHLIGAALLDEATDGGLPGESDAERQRSFHDRLLRSRSRVGHRDCPVESVFTCAGRIPPAPAVRPLPTGPALARSEPASPPS